MTEPFASGTTSAVMSIKVNGLTYASTTITVSTGPAIITSITPNSVSPVLKNIITLNVSHFLDILVPSDLSVSVISTTNTTLVRFINVIEVGNDNGNQYIKVKFGGSESGLYNVAVRSMQYGRFDTTGITL